jgi:hypothetical protein
MGLNYSMKRETVRRSDVFERLSRDIDLLSDAWAKLVECMGVERGHIVNVDMTVYDKPVIEGIYLPEMDIIVRCVSVRDLIDVMTRDYKEDYVYSRYFGLSEDNYKRRRREWIALLNG